MIVDVIVRDKGGSIGRKYGEEVKGRGDGSSF